MEKTVKVTRPLVDLISLIISGCSVKRERRYWMSLLMAGQKAALPGAPV